jgi:hypothetical protein
MSRYEKRIYFERLVAMHVAYARLDAEDKTPVMTIDEAIAWAELELEVAEFTPRTEP